ncbi:MAG: ester cyclase [Gemmatimonadota bacterium]
MRREEGRRLLERYLEEVLVEGDFIAFRSILQGTHRGTFRGISPTGRKVRVRLLDMVRVEDGAFVEQWGGPDPLDLLRQLGARVSTHGTAEEADE